MVYFGCRSTIRPGERAGPKGWAAPPKGNLRRISQAKRTGEGWNALESVDAAVWQAVRRRGNLFAGSNPGGGESFRQKHRGAPFLGALFFFVGIYLSDDMAGGNDGKTHAAVSGSC